MKLEEAKEKIKQVIYTEKGEQYNYIDIDNSCGNDVMCEEFIKAIETVLKELESYKERYELAIEQNIRDYKNSIPKKKLKETKDKIEKAMNLANDSIEERIVIADNDSLNFGRKQAHNYDIELIRELLEYK